MMKTKWPLTSIESLCSRVTSGGTPSRSNPSFFEGGTIPWIKTGELNDWYVEKISERITEEAVRSSSAKIFPPETVLLAMYGDGKTMGTVGLTKFPSASNQACCAMIVDRTKATPKFLLYSLIYNRPAILKLTVAGAQRNLSGATIKKFQIGLPPLQIQQSIASILSAYDDLIENNKRRIAVLEEMARRIYEEWFVHFRFPGHEKARMVESEMGLIPEKWMPSLVGECVTVHRGKSYKSTELADEGGLPFVNLKCMERDGGFRKSGLKRFTGSYKDTQKVTTGDLVMAVTDMTQERRIVARCGRVPRLGSDFGVISMDLVKIDANKGVPRDFIYGMFRWSGFADEVKQHANGANVLHLSPDRIAEYRFALPPSEITAQFAAFISPMLHQCDVLLEKNEVLRATRDLLLPKLISGELNVCIRSEHEEAIAA